MLAQNFMTAKSLGITKFELDVLIKVLGMLERGECDGFDMADVYHRPCGSPSCILGWADHVAGRVILQPKNRTSPLSVRTRELQDLFFPGADTGVYESDQATAAIALRNYLTTGQSRWEEVSADR